MITEADSQPGRVGSHCAVFGAGTDTLIVRHGGDHGEQLGATA
jgi:hypothetical protein